MDKSLKKNSSLKVALLGNPNSGKSSLFNQLTGLRQKTGNFPGVTVEKSVGKFTSTKGRNIELIDLPGTYSLFPKSLDEYVPFEILADKNNVSHPNLIIYIADAGNLARNLVLLTQAIDLEIPCILCLNMVDQAKAQGIIIDIEKLSKILQVPVIETNARKGTGIEQIKSILDEPFSKNQISYHDDDQLHLKEFSVMDESKSPYLNFLDFAALRFNKKTQKGSYPELNKNIHLYQKQDLLHRHKKIKGIMAEVINQEIITGYKKRQDRLDAVFTHPVFGYVIFLLILMIIFNSIFYWAKFPMDLIISSTDFLKEQTKLLLGDGILSSLIGDGIISGLGGIVAFIPQIAFLFLFISILDDTGYLSRVAFMMDRLMRRFGMSGKSVIPLISGTACAVPAIMATRNIENYKSRLITILVTPLMSCSARLPVYILLISLFVPDTLFFNFISLKAIVLLGMYLLGFFGVIFGAWIFNLFIKTKEKNYFILELPIYRTPNWNNVLTSVYRKVRAFIGEAGKIIVAISIVLWFLSSFGMPGKFKQIEEEVNMEISSKSITEKEGNTKINSLKLQNSFAGMAGRKIEFLIEPLGYDWKIGIALITSFAAREVFVGTLSTLYGLEQEDESLKNALIKSTNSKTGKPVYTLATALSLMVFYAFALQCMSTIGVTYKETGSKKWTIIQILFMTALAYVSAFLVYQGFK